MPTEVNKDKIDSAYQQTKFGFLWSNKIEKNKDSHQYGNLNAAEVWIKTIR
jgi:hypothetical protein